MSPSSNLMIKTNLHFVVVRNPLGVENHHFLMAEVRNFLQCLQNEGLDPIGKIQTGILVLGSLLEVEMLRSARRCGPKHVSKSTC